MTKANWLDNLITSDRPISAKIDCNIYENWRREMIFDTLQDLRYGQSFCNRFDIQDNILYYDNDQQRCDAYIRRHYLC
jgi:hypothetical protein